MTIQQNCGRPPRQVVFSMDLDSAWITKGATPAMVNFAESAARAMVAGGLTNSQIRNFYGEIKRIQMNGYENSLASFYLLRPKLAYACGRNNNDGLKLFKKIFEGSVSGNNVTDQRTFNNLCLFMEAILAYHKANGGK